ncbi:hypothetical protein [uncultured Adlercreutzia sp.]|uniref:hypothetical protein n=1 Tax=uncultured Adlercreutzia sp. TaxID=875803 RepID=UPI0025E14824|nr:hypothetical protein [uncultured Adlercreutzia sp.]
MAESITPSEEISSSNLIEEVDSIGTAVVRHPLNREVLYQLLVYCQEERTLEEAEQYAMTLPQFSSATQNPYRMLCTLVESKGLRRIERDHLGNEVTADMKEGLAEDDAEDIVASEHYQTTEAGIEFIEQYSPKSRLVKMLSLAPERSKDYCDLLEFVEEQPRTYSEIVSLLEGRDALQIIIAGHRETMQPSVFVDKLERAGALVWQDGWRLSEIGAEFLKEMKEANEKS